MKKALKITGITLASLIGLVLIVAVVAATMITSSGKLTKMVKKYAPQFVNCEMQLGKADLTLFKTFPNVGVEIENVALINPMVGSPSDTLANIDNLIVVADLKKFWKEDEIVVRKCILEDAFINLYTDSLGQNNLNVFNSKDDDTTSFSFDYLVDIEEVKLKNSTIIYTDDRSQMMVHSAGLNLDLKGKMKDNDIQANLIIDAKDLGLKRENMQLAINVLNLSFDGNINQMDHVAGNLKLGTPDISLDMAESYLKNDTINLDLPLQFSINDVKGHFDKAQIGLNKYLIHLDGDAEMAENGDINLDLDLSTSTLNIENVLTYMPQRVKKRLRGMTYTGKLNITEAEVIGTYNDSLMPIINAKVTTDNATLTMSSLPYPITNVNLDALLALDMNKDAGEMKVNSLNAKFHRSNFKAEGLVDDLFGAIGLKLKIKGDMPMTDLKSFLPKYVKLEGRANLDLTTNFTYDKLMKSLDDYNLNRLAAKANLKIKDFAFDMDTIHATSPMLNVGLVLPASAKEKGRKGAFVTLATNSLAAQMGKGITADLGQPDIKFSADNFKSGMEKMNLDADMNFSRLNLLYDDITARVEAPSIQLVTMPEKTSKGLKARVIFNGKDIDAKMGKDNSLNSHSLKIDASVNENKDKTDFLNRWNPTADFILNNAVVQVAGIDEDIRINNIDFLFNSSELELSKSTMRLGNSDISLQGSVIGIKQWIEDHKNLMKGELQLSSEMLNINEIMDLTSGLGRSDNEIKDEGQEKKDNPFMVPEGIDFNFGIKTNKSLFNNFDLNNLSGTMTVKDGTLILQEIGFTNKAAEMQLTALYQSPRKNNLFLAMDFHLLDVQINDLLHMIPYIDTLVPMLKTFDGQAEFHIGAETNLKSNYEPKISTFRAAADIEGKNLTVNDKFTFTKITDMLDVSTNGEYRVDSLDVQLTAFKNEIDLWPSQIAIGKYKVTVDGRMMLDKNGEYHLSVTESPLPVRLGLKISGPLNNLDYKTEKCKYPTLYKPNKRNEREKMYIELKKKIADRLKENVR